jgi:hypothetical protein
MAELILNVRSTSIDPKQYQNGDIICAFNQKRIRNVHAQHICNINNFGFNSDGLRPTNTLAQVYYEKSYKYKFERISSYEVKRIDLDTLDEMIFSNTPNENGEYIYVPEYIKDLKKHSKHKIFGNPGSEFWYGNLKNPDDSKLTEVWSEIEARTVYRETDFQLWPLTDIELKHFLVLKIDDFSDIIGGELVAPETHMEGEEIIIDKKRKNKVDWENLSLPNSINDIKDINKKIDIRGFFQFDRSLIVKTK